MGGHVIQHHRVCADAGSVSQVHPADDLGPGAHEHVVSERWGLPLLSAERHLMPTRKGQPPPDLTYFKDSAK